MAILHACSAELNSDGDRRCIAIGKAAAMAVTIFEDLVLRERGDPLLEVAVPQRQQRALVVEEGNARGQRRHLRLRNNPRPVKFADIFFFFILGEIQLEMLAGCRIQHASFFGRRSAQNA